MYTNISTILQRIIIHLQIIVEKKKANAIANAKEKERTSQIEKE